MWAIYYIVDNLPKCDIFGGMISSNDESKINQMIAELENKLKEKDTKIESLEAELRGIKGSMPMFITQSTFLTSAPAP